MIGIVGWIGSAASAAMAWLGSVAPGGVYASLQSAAMGGYGVGVVAGAVKGGAVAVSAVVGVWGRGRGK